MINIEYVSKDKIEETLYKLIQQDITPLLILDHQQTKVSNINQTNPPIYLSSGLHHINGSESDTCCELWSSSGVWTSGNETIKADIDGVISFYQSKDTLIGSLSVNLSKGQILQKVSELAYEKIIQLITNKKIPHLLRVWNYFPNINMKESTDDENVQLERYQQFCVGRHNAFWDKVFDYPAASAVGSFSSNSSKLVIVFIATKTKGLFIENPDQVSAYNYPKHYSPKSPSFARAAIEQQRQVKQLYISGTASITGHKSRFRHDVKGQTKLIIQNMTKLVEHINKQNKTQLPFKIDDSQNNHQSIKVYLRNPKDISIVSLIIKEFLPNYHQVCYLHADICRQELDVEIEVFLN